MGYLVNQLRTLFWTAFYHATSKIFFASLGPGSKFQGWIDIPQRRGRIRIGRDVHVCRSVEFSAVKDAELILGDRTFIGRGTVISAHQLVRIGADVLVAEYVSIHDNNHRTGHAGMPFAQQGFEAEPLEIGDDCWIGAQAVLVKGSGLGRRCVLGAGAVLTRSFPDNTRAIGVPARPISSEEPVAAAKSNHRKFEALHTPPRCPVCDAVTSRANLQVEYAYWRCLSCETVHLHPQPSTGFLEKFYDDFHLPALEGGVFENFEQRMSADFPAKARMVARCLAANPENGGASARVLDVGCGKGDFVWELARHGLHPDGIDFSRTAVNEGRQRGLDGLRAGDLRTQSDWAGDFDAVTSWATIEHVPDPKEFLDSIHSVLKPGGFLFLDTGLAGDTVDRWAPGLIQWYDAPQHLFVFSRRGMEKILEKSGFTVSRIDPHFERTTLRRITKFLRNRLLSFTAHSLFRLGLGKAAFARMRLEAKMPWGSVMFVIARRDRAS